MMRNASSSRVASTKPADAKFAPLSSMACHADSNATLRIRTFSSSNTPSALSFSKRLSMVPIPRAANKQHAADVCWLLLVCGRLDALDNLIAKLWVVLRRLQDGGVFLDRQALICDGFLNRIAGLVRNARLVLRTGGFELLEVST